MPSTDLVIPTTLDQLKQGIGEAILGMGFDFLQIDTEGLLKRGATGANNAGAAELWMSLHHNGVIALQWISQRALNEASSGRIITSFVSDLVKAPQSARILLVDSPQGYLMELVKATMGNDDAFASLLRLFLELPH